jgi:hypothetical protein
MQASETHRLLIVAGHTAAPDQLFDVIRRQAAETRIEATVVVPASLHGIEWAGDPRAAVPVAERHAALLQVALLNLGVARCEARVGDADAHAAVDDALRDAYFDEVIVNVRSPRIAHLLHVGLADRIAPERGDGVTALRPGRRRRAAA